MEEGLRGPMEEEDIGIFGARNAEANTSANTSNIIAADLIVSFRCAGQITRVGTRLSLRYSFNILFRVLRSTSRSCQKDSNYKYTVHGSRHIIWPRMPQTMLITTSSRLRAASSLPAQQPSPPISNASSRPL